MTYLQLLKENAHVADLPIQTEFFVPSEAQLISAFKKSTTKDDKNILAEKSEPNLAHKEKSILKRLKIKNIYEYDLSNIKSYKKLDELIYDRKPEDKRRVPELELIGICGKKKCTSTTNPKQILKPWRVQHIKI